MVGEKHVIYGIHVRDRIHDAHRVQDLFTEYGCHIKTRVGLHEVQGDFCSPGGVIVLEMFGDESECVALKRKLEAIDGIDVQEMVFHH